MTIKNRGGVFGRNPTFNNVTVDGTLTAPNLTVGDDLIVTDAIGVGTSSPLSSVDIRTAEGGSPTNATFDNALRLTSTATAGVGVGPSILFRGETGNAATPYSFAGIHGVKSSAAGSNYSGDLIFSTQNSGGATVLTEVARMLSTGGITFNGDTAAANALSDYEQGTWTPAISGTADTTYSTQYGWYTKVGNLVSVGFELTVNAEGTIAGNAAISGLPFTSGASDSKSSGSLSYSASSGYSSVWQGIIVGNNQTIASIYVKNAAGASTFSINGSDFFANGTQIIGQLTYKV
jgi:hypothetical protein